MALTIIAELLLQDALLFLQTFFTDLAADDAGDQQSAIQQAYDIPDQQPNLAKTPPTKLAHASAVLEPVMSLKELEEKATQEEGRAMFDEINEENENEASSREPAAGSTFFIK